MCPDPAPRPPAQRRLRRAAPAVRAVERRPSSGFELGVGTTVQRAAVDATTDRSSRATWWADRRRSWLPERLSGSWAPRSTITRRTMNWPGHRMRGVLASILQRRSQGRAQQRRGRNNRLDDRTTTTLRRQRRGFSRARIHHRRFRCNNRRTSAAQAESEPILDFNRAVRRLHQCWRYCSGGSTSPRRIRKTATYGTPSSASADAGHPLRYNRLTRLLLPSRHRSLFKAVGYARNLDHAANDDDTMSPIGEDDLNCALAR